MSNPSSKTIPAGPPLAPPPKSSQSALAPTALTTSGSGSALQAIPKNRKERFVRIEINSNDRDFTAYPKPSEFQWVCPYPLKNVTSMVIVGGTIPVPIYTIDDPFNSFTFDTGTVKKTLTFPPGLYTPLLFAPRFKQLLDAADGVNTYTVSVDQITQKLSVKSSGANNFGFLFKTGDFSNQYNPALQKMRNPAFMMGFADQDYYQTGTTIVSPFPVNLNPIQRIYVYMNYDTTIDLRSVVLAGGRTIPSAILYCTDQDSVAYLTKSLNKDTYENVISPGLIVPRIRTINISLRDEFGNVINTNNRPVTFLMELTVLD
jgi:hypothetical protein